MIPVSRQGADWCTSRRFDAAPGLPVPPTVDKVDGIRAGGGPFVQAVRSGAVMLLGDVMRKPYAARVSGRGLARRDSRIGNSFVCADGHDPVRPAACFCKKSLQ
jgi:hypothetical protein